MANPNKLKFLILVANASEARIYKTSKLGETMALADEYTHPDSRKKGIDLVTDRPGHYKSRGTGRGVLIEPTPPKEVAYEHFAIQLAQELEKKRKNGLYDHLVLIAPPHFHGLLKKHASTQVLDHVIYEIEKDYTKTTQKELQQHLKDISKPSLAA